MQLIIPQMAEPLTVRELDHDIPDGVRVFRVADATTTFIVLAGARPGDDRCACHRGLCVHRELVRRILRAASPQPARPDENGGGGTYR